MTNPIADFIETNKLEHSATVVPENPHWVGESKYPTVHYHVAMKRAGSDKTFTFYYSVGEGYIDRWLHTKGPARIRAQLKRLNPRCVMADDICRANRNLFKPDIVEMLECLHGDFSSIHCGNTFEDWADDLGWSSDSIKAKQCYDTIALQMHQFRDYLGYAAFIQFMDLDPNDFC